jgi:hypothetical protein
MTELKTKVEYLNQPPRGWFVLDVMKRKERGRDWVALMIDIDPDTDDFRVWGRRPVSRCFILIPGEHRSRDAAYDTLENMMATRH